MGENGALDVDKDSCYQIHLSSTVTTKITELIEFALEKKTTTTNANSCCNCLVNPASFPILRFDLKGEKRKKMYTEMENFNFWNIFLSSGLLHSVA